MRAKVANHNKQNEKLIEKIHQIMEIDGQAGLTIKVCLLAGLTESEALYCFNQEICDNFCCSCHKLHVITKQNGVTIIILNWTRDNGRRIYFAILPTLLWQRFRELASFNEADIIAAAKVVKKAAGMELPCVCRIFYAVMKTAMDKNQIDILVGKASPCAAKCLLLSNLDYLTDNYVNGWQQVGLVLPVL